MAEELLIGVMQPQQAERKVASLTLVAAEDFFWPFAIFD